MLLVALLIATAGGVPAHAASVGTAAVVGPNSIATAPPFSSSRTMTLVYATWAGTGVASVELWVKGPSDQSFRLVATDTTTDTPSFSFEAPDDGTFRFYTRARDALGSYESAPASADTATTIDTVAPTTSASGPATSTSTMIDIGYSVSDADPSSGLDRVELWARGPGATAYTRLDSDASPAGTGSFEHELPSEAARYRFYTLAVDRAGNFEEAPAEPDVETDLTDPGAPEEGLIAFASNRDGDYDIYKVNTDGTGWVTELIGGPSEEREPAWSPTGAKVAFASDRDGDYDIYVVNADGTGMRRITDRSGSETSPSWSPDGREIAFGSGREIFVVEIDTGAVRQVTHGAPYCYYNDGVPYSCGRQSARDPSWAPDASRIVFMESGGQRDSHWLSTIDSSGNTQSTRFWGGYESGPDWSVDDRIAASTTGDDPDIYYLNSDRTGYTILTDRHGDITPSWSPDATALAFVRSAEIVRLGDDGEGLQRLTYNPAFDGDPDWQPRLYRNAKRFCDAQRAQIGAAAFARLYGADGGKGKKRSGDQACRAAYRSL